MSLESMSPELIGEIVGNLCYVDRKAFFDASPDLSVLRDKIKPWLHLDPLSTVVYASLYAYEGRCDHVTAVAFKNALDDIETGLRCLLQKSYVEYFHLDSRLTYRSELYAPEKPSDLKTDAKHRYLDLLLRPRCNGQAHYEYYLEVMEAYGERRSNDPNPLLPLGCQGGRVDIKLYDVLKRVRSYVYDWICEVQWKEKIEMNRNTRRRMAGSMKEFTDKWQARQLKAKEDLEEGLRHSLARLNLETS